MSDNETPPSPRWNPVSMPVSGRNRQWVGRDSNSQPTPSRCGAETPQKVARRNWTAVQPAESADGIRSAQARGRCSSGGWPECAEGSLFLKPYPAEVHLTHSNIADSDGRRSNDLLIHCLLPAAPCVCQTWTPRPGWHLPDADPRSDLPVRRTQEPCSDQKHADGSDCDRRADAVARCRAA